MALWRGVARSVRPFETHERRSKSSEPPAKPSIPKGRPVFPESADPRVTATPRTVRPLGRPEPPTRIHPAPPLPHQRSAKLPGVDGATARRLKRGTQEPDARLDLHGMTAEHAHRTLVGFILQAHRSGARLALVITGKGGRRESADGLRPAPPGQGVLKSLTPDWLAQPPLSACVVGVYPAHQRHGGAGALYVYLRKPPGGRNR